MTDAAPDPKLASAAAGADPAAPEPAPGQAPAASVEGEAGGVASGWRALTRADLGLAVVVLMLTTGLHVLHHAVIEAKDWPLELTIDEQQDLRRSQAAMRGEWPLRGRAFYQAPLYPALLSAVRWAGGGSGTDPLAVQRADAALTARMRTAQFGVIGLVAALTFLFGCQLHSRLAGGIAALAVGASVELLVFGRLLTKSSWALLLVTAGLYVFCAARSRPRLGTFALAGWLLGLACLARGNLLALMPLFGLLAMAVEGSWRDRGARLLVLAGAAFVGVLPAFAWNLSQGQSVLTTWQGGTNFYSGNWALDASSGGYMRPPFVPAGEGEVNGDPWRDQAERELGRRPLSDAEVSRHWFARGWQVIAANPGDWLRLWGRKLRLFWAAYDQPDIVDLQFMRDHGIDPWLRYPLPRWGWLVLLAPAGLVALARRREGRPLLALLLGSWLVLSLFLINGRYRYALIPALALGAGVAVAEVVRAWREGRRAPAGWLACSLLLGALIAYGPLRLEGRLPAAASMVELGVGFERRGGRESLEKASEWYEKALADSPDAAASDTVRIMLANVRDQLGDVAGARSLLERAVQAEPDNALGCYLLGTILAESRPPEPARARMLLRRATRFAGRDPRPWRALGILERNLENYDAAAAALERFLALRDEISGGADPQPDLVAIAALAWVQVERERWAEAARRFEPVIADLETLKPLGEEQSGPLLGLARCYLELGDDAALEATYARIDALCQPAVARRLREILESLRR